MPITQYIGFLFKQLRNNEYFNEFRNCLISSKEAFAVTADYSRAELERMQAEAVRRVRDMQERARKSVGGAPAYEQRNKGQPTDVREERSGGRGVPPHGQSNRPSYGPARHAAHEERHEETPPEHRPPQKQPAKSGGFNLLNMLNLKNLNLEGDRTLILLLLVLLAGEETDTMLLLALLYIML